MGGRESERPIGGDVMYDTVSRALFQPIKNMQTPSGPNPLSTSWFWGVAEDCCMLSTLPCSAFLYLQFLARCHPYILTSIKSIKNEIGCRDDTVPKTVGTRRHCEEDGEHATIFRNPQKSRCREGVAEDCCMLSILLAVPSCTYSFWHGVIPTSYFIFNDFYTCFTIFFMQAKPLTL